MHFGPSRNRGRQPQGREAAVRSKCKSFFEHKLGFLYHLCLAAAVNAAGNRKAVKILFAAGVDSLSKQKRSFLGHLGLATAANAAAYLKSEGTLAAPLEFEFDVPVRYPYRLLHRIQSDAFDL